MIDRIVHGGEQGILTTAPVKRFFLTSGSTAKSKYIPVTSMFIRNKSRAFGIYWSAVFEQHPEAKAGRMVTNFSDSGEAIKAPGGLPCSSESAFWAGVTRATQLKTKPIIPKAVAQIGDSDGRYYAIARILLEEEFSVIMTLNRAPSSCSSRRSSSTRSSSSPTSKRAGSRPTSMSGRRCVATSTSTTRGTPSAPRRCGKLDPLVAHRIWPKARARHLLAQPDAAAYIDLLGPHFGDRAQRDYIMMAPRA